MPEISLPRQSWRIVFARLNNPEGWCKTTKSYANAMNVLAKPTFEDMEDWIIPATNQQLEELLAQRDKLKPSQIEVLEIFRSSTAGEEWLSESLTETLSEKQIDTVKSCLLPSIEQGSLPISPKFVMPIFKAFNLATDED